MTDQKTEPKKITPESTRRFRLTVAALKSVEEAADHEVFGAIREFESFKELYIAARMREVDARQAENPTHGLVSMASALDKAPRGTLAGAVPRPYPGAQEKFFAQTLAQEKAEAVAAYKSATNETKEHASQK